MVDKVLSGKLTLGPDCPEHPQHRLWLQGRAVAEDLRSIGPSVDFAVPRVHGNGFVQVDLTKGGSRRLHIWGHPAIPAQKTWTGIHDHVYTVASEVIVGRIIDITWRVRPCDSDASQNHATHSIYRAQPVGSNPQGARPVYDTQLVNTERRVSARIERTMAYGEGAPGSHYLVPAGVFHSSVEDGVAATVMTKVAPCDPQDYPRILVPLGRRPDNSFSRHSHDTTVLLGIIGEVVPNWLYLLDR